MIRKLILTGAGVLGVLVLAHGQAFADAGDALVATAVEEANTSITTAVNQTTSAVDRASNNISNSNTQALKQLSGQNTINSQAIVHALSNIATTEDTRAVGRKIEQATLNAENQASSGNSACNVITGTIAGAAINAEVAQYQEQATQAQLAYDLGGDKQAPSPSYNGTAAAISQVLANHCKYAATQSDVEAGLCPAVTAPPSAQPGQAGAVADTVPPDVNANNFIAPQYGVIPSRDINALNPFIALAFNSRPMGAMTPGQATTKVGRRIAYNRLVAAAGHSIPDAVASGIFARKIPFPDANKTIQGGTVGQGPVSAQSWGNSMMQQILGTSGQPQGGYFPNGISEDAWLSLRAEGWYMNPNWSVTLNGDNQTQAIKDLTMIEAFRAFMQNKQYHLLEQQDILLAKMDETLSEIRDGQR